VFQGSNVALAGSSSVMAGGVVSLGFDAGTNERRGSHGKASFKPVADGVIGQRPDCRAVALA
jgi:hypothetical protein